MQTSLKEFEVEDNISHVEIAAINYDQWILTVAVRKYAHEEKGRRNDSVVGMSHVIFEQVTGFRMLDEGDMLMFPWTDLDSSKSYVHRIDKGGWSCMETDAKNMIPNKSVREYLVKTENECVSVLACKAPRHANS